VAYLVSDDPTTVFDSINGDYTNVAGGQSFVPDNRAELGLLAPGVNPVRDFRGPCGLSLHAASADGEWVPIKSLNDKLVGSAAFKNNPGLGRGYTSGSMRIESSVYVDLDNDLSFSSYRIFPIQPLNVWTTTGGRVALQGGDTIFPELVVRTDPSIMRIDIVDGGTTILSKPISTREGWISLVQEFSFNTFVNPDNTNFDKFFISRTATLTTPWGTYAFAGSHEGSANQVQPALIDQTYGLGGIRIAASQSNRGYVFAHTGTLSRSEKIEFERHITTYTPPTYCERV